MSEEDTKNSDAEAELQEPLLSVKEDEPVLAAPVAEEVIRTTDAEVVEPSHVPMEKWKDGLCDCFTNVGCCHQSTICACCCPLGKPFFVALLFLVMQTCPKKDTFPI